MINIIIPMAGYGKRFSDVGITIPKPLISIKGKTLAEHAIESVPFKDSNYVFITRPFEDESYNNTLSQILRIKDNLRSELRVSNAHLGTAHSCTYAEQYFKENEWSENPLIIINSDQILNWNVQDFINFIKEKDPDGAVILHKSSNPKNSFAKINKRGEISEIMEKVVISDDALIGLHYWKKASDFFSSSKELFDKMYWNRKEVYVSETYNFLIKRGKTILPYYFEDGQYISLGTPEDIDNYVGNDEWRSC
jgi:NDP-sugar pyrophosphorylase family protein